MLASALEKLYNPIKFPLENDALNVWVQKECLGHQRAFSAFSEHFQGMKIISIDTDVSL